MLKVIWWFLLLIFLISTATAVTIRSTGDTGAVAENGRYFVQYRSTRHEVTREEYDQTRRRNHVAEIAAATMMISLFAFIGIHSLRRTARNRK